MAFDGYIKYGGVELVNNARLSEYVKNLGIDSYRCSDQCPTLQATLEHLKWKGSTTPYTTPDVSPLGPWMDFSEPYSKNFAGIHILEWTNIDSSTYTSTAQELVGDGASIAGERYAGREMTVRALLLGTDLLACRHGFNWLTAVLKDGDPCAANVRRRHTYADFLPYGKEWWWIYKATGADARPDNAFQAVRYNGLSGTDEPIDPAVGDGTVVGSGNTYAKLSHSEGDLTLPPLSDVLDLLIPLRPEDIAVPPGPLCGGQSLEFFVQCPEPTDATQVYRKVYDVFLMNGPVIVSEHEMGPGCDGGAWYEVEFTLMATNPFVWRWPNNMLGTQSASEFTFAQLLSQWIRYKDSDATVDDDVYQAPPLYGESHTYSGLISAMFDIEAGLLPVLPGVPKGREIAPLSHQESPYFMVLDPACPPLTAYPSAPQEEFVCAPIYTGEYVTLRYNFLTETLPKFTPSTVRFRLISKADEAMRDIQVRIIPPSGSEMSANIIEFHVTYLPPQSQLFIDGVRRSIDILTGDPSDVTSLFWSPADHLVLSHGLVGSYTFPEITCGRKVVLAIDVPVIYNPSTDLEFDLVTVQRDA